MRLTVLVATLVLLGSAPAAVAAEATVPTADVQGDDAGDRYVGTGGVLLPSTVATPTRSRVAGCGNCQWRMVSPCVTLAGPGALFPGQSTCQSVVRGCPAMSESLRVWFKPAAGGWEEIGLVCLPRGGPVTMANLRRQATARFTRDLPKLDVRFAPPSGVLAQLPVVFDSTQSGDGFGADYEILGQTLHLRAATTWSWDFGDGSVLDTAHPGGSYPDLSVSHAYRQAGRFPVRVIARWAAEFEVGGLGPFSIDEPVVQDAQRELRVGEGRAVLAMR